MKYEIELNYGYQKCEDGIYHAFEATDTLEAVSHEDMGSKLAHLLDCEPNDERFAWAQMRIAIPEKTVERIRMEGFAAGRAGLLAQMIEGPWNNDACKGYAIMAMVRAGLDPETIRDVSGAMTDCFDDTSVEEAGRYYVKGAIY